MARCLALATWAIELLDSLVSIRGHGLGCTIGFRDWWCLTHTYCGARILYQTCGGGQVQLDSLVTSRVQSTVAPLAHAFGSPSKAPPFATGRPVARSVYGGLRFLSSLRAATACGLASLLWV